MKKNRVIEINNNIFRNLPYGDFCTLRMLVSFVTVVCDTKFSCVALGAQLILGILSSMKAPLKIPKFSLFR